MGKAKRGLPAAVAGGPKERHRRAQRSQIDPSALLPGLEPKAALPKLKHHSYLELVENKDRKKKLEFKFTNDKTPPPGFEFIPITNPELTSACKELSRDKDAMVFIVSSAKEALTTENRLAHQTNRIGHHVRGVIVEEARVIIDQPIPDVICLSDDKPEPIPSSEADYHLKVDAALRDLFPRIPNTDRQTIIEHSFSRNAESRPGKQPRNGDPPVGFAAHLPLVRRVQLAVLAHIRHTHTRYDEILGKIPWQDCRKVVEATCLDILVKWRGDDESGRAHLDEILREVVVISDSESDDDDTDDEVSSDDEATVSSPMARKARERMPPSPVVQTGQASCHRPVRESGPPGSRSIEPDDARAEEKRRQRGFKRYRVWQEALRRNRGEDEQAQHPGVIRMTEHGHPDLSGFELQPSLIQDRTHPGDRRPSDAAAFAGDRRPPRFASGHPDAQGILEFVSQGHSHAQGPVQGLQTEIPQKSPRTPRTVSTSDHRLQDMLVHSIESSSPEAPRPSFVRYMPPRDSAQPAEPTASSSASRDFPPSHLTDGGPAPAFVRRAANEPSGLGFAHQGDTRRVSSSAMLRTSSHGSYPTLVGPSRLRPSALPPSRVREFEASSSTEERPAKRILVDAHRPGSRLDPILMEDRGGFYERVPVAVDSPPRPPNPGFIELRRSDVDRPAFPQPYRMVPLDEAPVLVRDAPRNLYPGIGSRHLSLPPETQSYPGAARFDPNPRPSQGVAEPRGSEMPWTNERMIVPEAGVGMEYSQPVYQHFRDTRRPGPHSRQQGHRRPRAPPHEVIYID